MIPQTFAMTRRENEIVSLVLQGQQTAEIARQLGITDQSVKNRLRIIYSRASICGPNKSVQLIKNFSSSAEKKPLLTLSNRQRAVAELVISGATSREIAAQFNTTEQTIKNCLRIVFDKCGAWSRTELAARYRCDETKTETQSIA